MNIRSLITAGALVTMGLLAGRVLGLAREILLASYFGAGSQADLAISLLVVPDFITGALAGSAVAVTLLPHYASRDDSKASALCWQAAVASFGVFGVLSLVVGLAITGVAWLQAEGAAPTEASPLAFLIAISAIPLTAATAVFASFLQHRAHFAVPAFANVIFNTGIILALVLMPTGLIMLAFGIVLAALLRLASHVAAFFRAGGRGPRGALTPWQLDRPMARTYLTTVTTDVCNLFPQFAPYLVIAALGGALAVFNYAFRLAFVPATLTVTLAQLVLLPWFVKQQRDGNHENGLSHYTVMLQVAWCFSLAACLSLSLAAHDIAQLCFGYGKMGEDDVGQVARLFDIGVWALPGMFITSIWQQIMYARGQAKLSMLAALVLALCIAPACWIGYQATGLSGVALAYAILQFLPAAWLACAGYKQGIISRLRPSASYLHITLAVLAAWLPLAWLFAGMELPPAAGLGVAVLIGMTILAAGLAACRPVRRWALQKIGYA